jgi:hypothetical protein
VGNVQEGILGEGCNSTNSGAWSDLPKMSFSPLREANAALEAYANQNGSVVSEEDEDDVFHIPPKPSLDMLKKWRVSLLPSKRRNFR